MVMYGFTGSQKEADDKIILDLLRTLNLTSNDMVITGACKGYDAKISHITKQYFPFVKQLIIVPFNRDKVDVSVYNNGRCYFMPIKTNYRDRNEKVVCESDKVIAFWTGKKIYSGTYMTINIAKRANKLTQIIMI